MWGWEDGKISEITVLGSLSEEKDEDETDEYQSELQYTNMGAHFTMTLYAYFLNLGLAHKHTNHLKLCYIRKL